MNLNDPKIPILGQQVAQPNGRMEAVWESYRQVELKHVTDPQMVGELRKAFFLGLWTHHEFFKKVLGSKIDPKEQLRLINDVNREIQSVVAPFKKGVKLL